MLTTTHVALNGALSRLAGSGHTGPVAAAARRLLPGLASRRAIVLGGLAPDVGLTLLSLGAAVWFPTVRGWTVDATFRHVYDTLFYEAPTWVVAHNVLHAPVVLLTLLVLGARVGGRTGRVVTAFAVGCLLHTAVDVVTHVTDGPLVLFPFDWETRVRGPVSYWDPRHGGTVLGPIDAAISVAGGGWLALAWWRDRRRDRHGRPT